MSQYMKKRAAKFVVLFAIMTGLCMSGGQKSGIVKADGASAVGNPVIKGGVSNWDCIYFGNYYQEDTNGDGTANERDAKTPVKWRVLSVDGDNAFLLADQNLDCQSYHEEVDVTWETSDLRNWLNTTFYDIAFQGAEKAAIRESLVKAENNPRFGTSGGKDTTDHIFILSLAEVSDMAYGFDTTYYVRSKTREAKNTPYAAARGAYTVEETEENKDYIGNGQWWLRTPGTTNTYASGVSYHGFCTDNGLNVGNIVCAVRPALHISLSSPVWKSAGRINSYGEEIPPEEEVTTGSPTPASAEPSKAPTETTVPEKDLTPNAVKGFKVTSPKKETVLCQWTVDKNVKKCEIQCSATKDFSVLNRYQVDMKKGKYQVKAGSSKVCYVRMRSCAVTEGSVYYSDWTKVKKVAVSRIDPPKAVKGFRITTKRIAGDIKIFYLWKNDTSSSTCEMYLSKDKNFKKKWRFKEGMSKGSFQIGGGSKGTYYAKMRTYLTFEGKKYYSKWSAVKSLKVK